MNNSGWFAALLFIALAASWLLSWLQQRAYAKASQRLGQLYAGRPNAVLVSGRGKGIARGAIALLVVDSSSDEVVAAETMEGVSVLARFKQRPELCGSRGSIMQRVTDRQLARAVGGALEQYRVVRAGGTSRLA